MAINWESIEGYSEDMSAEDKLALLDKHQFEPPTPPEGGRADGVARDTDQPDNTPLPVAGKVVPKAQFDKAATELAALKKQMRARMSEDEVKELERQQEQESIRQELEALRRDKSVSEYKAAYLGLGFEEQAATGAASALAEGDFDAVFAGFKKHMIAMEKSLRAQILKETPTPPPGENKDPEKVDPFEEAFKKG